MTLNEGKTYKFRYLADVYSKSDVRYLKVCLADGPDSANYIVRPLASQLKHGPTYPLYCKVLSIEDNGFVHLAQDEMSFYKEIYKPDQAYSFVILEEIDPTPAGVRRVILECQETKLTHTYTCFDGMSLPVGNVVKYFIKLLDKNGHAAIHFIKKEEELSEFLPENVFKSIGHEDLKEHFFDNIEEWTNIHKAINAKVNKMKVKLTLNNRLWIFDYVRVLILVTILPDAASLEDVEKCCILIKDIESWILNESGLLYRFNEQNREETRRKSETMISKSDNTLEAISIIKNNKQVEFVQDIVDKSSRGIQCEYKTISILLRIIGLNRDIIQNNISAFSQLIEFNSSDFGDDDIAERIVNVLANYISRERKLLNQELHLGRKKEIDKKVLSDLIIGIGTLFNFCNSKELGKDNDLSLNQDKLFLALCKYVGYLCSKEKALQLVNRSLLFLTGKGADGAIDGNILRSVSEDPDALADNILSIENVGSRSVAERYKDNLHINYVNDNIVIYRGNRLQGKDNIDLSTCVFTLPDVSLQLHDLSALEEWDSSYDLLYYREKWKEYLNKTVFHMDVEEASDYVHIKVKPVNPAKSNLIFCTRTDTDIKCDGVIHYRGYCPNFLCSDLTKIFRSNMEFLAKIDKREDSKINFNITRNIRDFSNKLAENQESECIGMCLSIQGKRAFFITTNGITCSSYLQYEYEVMEGDMFALNVDASVDPKFFPVASLVRELPKTHNREALLTNQLDLLSKDNKVAFYGSKEKKEQSKQLPNIHLIFDALFHIYKDKVTRYNLYQIARLVCLVENRSLANYYASCIQYMEMMECFERNIPVEYSFEEVQLHSSQFEKYPSLQNHKRMHDLLCNFGAENDIDALYALSTNKELPDRVNRFARLSLAYALIESVTDDEKITGKIKNLAISEIGNDSDDEVITNENEVDDEDDEALSIDEKTAEKEESHDDGVEEFQVDDTPEEDIMDMVETQERTEEKPKAVEPVEPNSKKLCFFENGSYIISISPDVDGITHQVSYTEKSIQMFVLQCYGNGNINKIPVKNLSNLREEYEYRNGVYRETTLERCLIVGPNDYVLALYTSNNKDYCRLASVASVVVHSSLGLRGTPVICSNDIQKISWYALSAAKSANLSAMIREASTGSGVQMDDDNYSNELLWIKQNILNESVNHVETAPQQVELNDNEVIRLLDAGEHKLLLEIFDQFTIVGRTVPKGQALAREALSAVKDPESFWKLIDLLLECNINVYRKPITDVIDDSSLLQSFKPDTKMLDRLVNSVFNYDDKYNHSLAFVYHYRDSLSDKAKDFIYNTCSVLAKPSDYKLFSEIVDLDFDEDVEVLLEDAVPASYYRLYELLDKYRAEYGKVEAKRVAHKIIDGMIDKSTSAQVFKQLVNYAILEHISGHEHLGAIKRILTEGYHAFGILCSKKESKIETQRIVSQVAAGVRKKKACSVLGVYQNHYVLTSSNGLSTLLPKNCANREYHVGHSLRVHIVHVDAQHHTLFVSEKPNSDIQTVMSLPLLILNEEIEVRFSNIGKIVPSAIKCFSRTQIQINHYPDGFDYKKKYRGKVIKRIDYFTYEVQLLSPIE